jgi:hypothetical protein
MIEPTNGSASHEITHPKKRAMLAALARTGNVSAAARAADICRRTHYDWLGSDPDYRPAVEQAMEEAADVLEAVARQRAIVGSDTLLIFLLKAVRPEKFRERRCNCQPVEPPPELSIEEKLARMPVHLQQRMVEVFPELRKMLPEPPPETESKRW